MGRRITFSSSARMASESPSSASVGARLDLSSRRMTTFSPSTVGSVATRMSSRRPTALAESVMRPSCGLRRSAMSSFASTFRRVVTPAAMRFGTRWVSRRTPSTRKRTTSASSCGSKWTSEAFSSAAWNMIAFTRRTSGPSEMPSSTSRSSPASSVSVSTKSVPNASAARTSRRSSASMSSLEATPSSSECFVASRSSSIACRLPGSATATRSTSPSSAYGIATARSSVWTGMSWAASAATPTSRSSTSGR